MSFEILKKELEKRLRKGSFPPFWTPKNKGEVLVGQVISVRPSIWDEKIKVYEVRTFEGETYSTPNNDVLNRLLEESEVKPGDYIMIRYEGIITTRRGRKAKDFSVAVLSKEEAEKILKTRKESVKPLVPQVTEETQKPAEPEPPKPLPLHLEPERKIEFSRVPDEVKEFIDELFGFYTDGMPEEQFRKYLERRNIRIPMVDLMKECNLVVSNGIVRRA